MSEPFFNAAACLDRAVDKHRADQNAEAAKNAAIVAEMRLAFAPLVEAVRAAFEAKRPLVMSHAYDKGRKPVPAKVECSDSYYSGIDPSLEIDIPARYDSIKQPLKMAYSHVTKKYRVTLEARNAIKTAEFDHWIPAVEYGFHAVEYGFQLLAPYVVGFDKEKP